MFQETEKVKAMCDVFNEVFSKQLKAEEFYYKHYQNPFKFSSPVYHEHTDEGEVTGINAFLGAKFILKSRIILAAQSCDSAVLPRHQGKGIFSRLIRTAEKQCATEDTAFVYGFPNKNSYPGFIKLGWTHVGDFTRAYLPLNAEKLLERKIGKLAVLARLLNPFLAGKLAREAKKSPELTIQVSETCPFNKSDFAAINNVRGIMTERSKEYYAWKVDNNPTRGFNYVVARAGDKLLGFLIYEATKDGSISVVDWQCCDSNLETKICILAKLFSQLRGQGDVINVGYVNRANGELELLRNLGFRNAATSFAKLAPMPLVVKVLAEDEDNAALLDQNCWICRSLDSDVLLS